MIYYLRHFLFTYPENDYLSLHRYDNTVDTNRIRKKCLKISTKFDRSFDFDSANGKTKFRIIKLVSFLVSYHVNRLYYCWYL